VLNMYLIKVHVIFQISFNFYLIICKSFVNVLNKTQDFYSRNINFS